jgi:hypothetical protein
LTARPWPYWARRADDRGFSTIDRLVLPVPRPRAHQAVAEALTIPGHLRLEAATIEEENNMKFEMIGAATLSRAMKGKHVAAQWHYQTKFRNVPPSLDSDGSAGR